MRRRFRVLPGAHNARSSDFETRSHGFAAMAMFGALALAAAVNAWQCYRCHRRWYFRIYLVIAVAMIAAVGIMFSSWEYEVLAVEVVEIAMFAAFWLVQTRELWHDTVRPAPAVPTIPG